MNVESNRLYQNRQDENKVVVIKEIAQGEITFLHAPPMNSDIHWFVPPKRETLLITDFIELHKPFKS